ncbi:MAG: YeeE/YedE family protein [Acidobacteria bacterium]|nr:YeeE/YedE family protein [Acidobacteriota bacterium]
MPATKGPASTLAWMFVGGLFIGFGTRLGGGCTSGHGIFGMSNLELPSIVTAVSFMAGGIVTTQLVYRVVFA